MICWDLSRSCCFLDFNIWFGVFSLCKLCLRVVFNLKKILHIKKLTMKATPQRALLLSSLVAMKLQHVLSLMDMFSVVSRSCTFE